jgi:hypothetical protein
VRCTRCALCALPTWGCTHLSDPVSCYNLPDGWRLGINVVAGLGTWGCLSSRITCLISLHHWRQRCQVWCTRSRLHCLGITLSLSSPCPESMRILPGTIFATDDKGTGVVVGAGGATPLSPCQSLQPCLILSSPLTTAVPVWFSVAQVRSACLGPWGINPIPVGQSMQPA